MFWFLSFQIECNLRTAQWYSSREALGSALLTWGMWTLVLTTPHMLTIAPRAHLIMIWFSNLYNNYGKMISNGLTVLQRIILERKAKVRSRTFIAKSRPFYSTTRRFSNISLYKTEAGLACPSSRNCHRTKKQIFSTKTSQHAMFKDVGNGRLFYMETELSRFLVHFLLL